MNVVLLILFVINAVYGEQFSALFSSDIDVSEGCRTAVQRLSMLQATKPQLMARYWDSWGKPSDGILTGHTTFLGYYDECINLKNTDLGDMKYCIYPMVMDTNIMQRSIESEDGVCHSSNCPMSVNTYSVLNVKVGVCYPSVCSANEFAVVLSKMNITSVTTVTSDPFSGMRNFIIIKLITKDSSPFCPITDVEYDAGAKAVIAVCTILVGLVVVGTIVDMVLWRLSSDVASFEENGKSKDLVSGENNSKDINKEIQNLSKPTEKSISNHSTIKDYILAFSLYTTIPNLLMRQSPSAIKAMSGLKIISNLIIITFHVLRFTVVLFPAIPQNYYLQQVTSKLIFQPIINTTFAVDTFFVVSGTLSAYLALKDMERHKRFRFAYFYLNRYFRLSLLLYLHTLIAYKLSPQFGQGPAWFPFDVHAFENSWQYVLLYLSNTGYMHNSMMYTCVGMTWHISAEMQLFVFSPIFVILLYHVQYVGLAAVAITMIVTTATVGYVSAINGYWAAMSYNPHVSQQVTGLYNKAFFRANSYLTGILLGYVLYKKYNIATLPIRHSSKWLIYTLLWVVGIMLCLVTMFGTYAYGEYSFTYHFSDLENVMFLMFSGLAWSIGITIIIYICNTGYGGVVNTFLSLPGWEPLVKLTYGVALNHVMIMLCVVGTLQMGLKYTNTVLAMIVIFIVVLSYSVAAITAVFVEQPIFRVVSLSFKLAGMEVRSK